MRIEDVELLAYEQFVTHFLLFCSITIRQNKALYCNTSLV